MLSKFKIGANEWIVGDRTNPGNQNELGVCVYAQNTILLDTICEGDHVSEISRESTYWHEVIHAILYSMGMNDLTKDETFVQTLSVFIRQHSEQVTQQKLDEYHEHLITEYGPNFNRLQKTPG